MKDLLKNKTFIAVASTVLILIIVFVVFMVRNNGKSNNELQEQLTNAEAIPTVDASVKVNLVQGNRTGEVILTVDKAPQGTSSIEYQLTYDAVSREEGSIVPRGVIGTCTQQFGASGTWTCQQPNNKEAITLGTCSSGTCVYDNIKGDINVQLKFTGSYGEKIYEKDFNI
ncbi:MAG: hypothetical protein ABH812_03305 [bacterium]